MIKFRFAINFSVVLLFTFIFYTCTEENFANKSTESENITLYKLRVNNDYSAEIKYKRGITEQPVFEMNLVKSMGF
ncbi:MAG: hypothetical protein IT237_00540 [Bacteroidia bacterium]|nr:hypothetical protein [Bacteroidia bacterium]